MRYDGPTMALHVDNNFSELANITMSAPRYMNRPSPGMLPPQMKNAFTSPGLSLGLPNCPELLQLEPRPLVEVPPPVDHHIGKVSKTKEDENESRSGSGSENNMGNASGDEQGPPRKKRYHRHSTVQIAKMEALFKECPHPDDKQRQELSSDLGLEPRQVKFWFQNRRTQMKAQQERAENNMLRNEIERLRVVASTMRQTLRNATCPNCGGPANFRDMSVEEQHLRAANNIMKDEIQRVSDCGYFRLPGLPPPLFSPSPPPLASQMSLPVEDSFKDSSFSEAEKANFLETATLAMDELMQLCQAGSTVWGSNGIFNNEEYMRLFPKNNKQNNGGLKTDASRGSTVVPMFATDLVETFMSPAKWMDFFPVIISKACAYEVPIPQSNGTLQVVQAEFHALSPLIKSREVNFLRYCKQLTECTWIIVDVSPDAYDDVRCRKRPSGFLIQELPNGGGSKVVAVEHMEYDDTSTHELVQSLVSSGAAFGASRWLATLLRECEAFCSYLNGNSPRDLTGIPNGPERHGLLRLSKKMTSSFCAGVGSSSGNTWSSLTNGEPATKDIRITYRKSDNPSEPHGIVLSAVTTIWLPTSPERVSEYIRLEHIRNEWDITSGAMVYESARFSKGQPGNDVSLFSIQSPNNNNNTFLLQESCTDASGSLVVYAPVELPMIQMLLQDGDPTHVPIVPSGYVILPDGPEDRAGLLQLEGDTSVPRMGGGTLLTVAVQILISDVPKLTMESINAISSLISTNVDRVKSALASNI